MEMKYLMDYYNNKDEEGRLGTRYGSVEFLTTMRYIQRYLRPNSKIIEIGAGTGRYSHAIARMGNEVDAVELVPRNIDVFSKNTQIDETITITQGNALDLNGFADSAYDITLLLGPLYHLFSQKDKRQAISEAIRVTKQGGVVFAAYCISDGSLLHGGFNKKSFNIMEFIKNGFIDPETFTTRSTPELIFELVRKEDIDELMSVFPTTRLHYVATDGYAVHMKEALEEMDDEMFALYLKYHFTTCERGDMVGLTNHSLDIFEKKGL